METQLKPRLIALYAPRAQSGKSTIATWLVENRKFALVKFAAPVKNMVRGLLNSLGTLSHAQVERMVEGDLKEAVIPGFETATPRHLLQSLGTDWGREAVDMNLWADVGIRKAKSLMAFGHSIVIDDLRFPNEHAAVVEAGGECWRVVRPDAPEAGETRYEGLLEGHSFRRYVANKGDLGDLHWKLRGLVDTTARTTT